MLLLPIFLAACRKPIPESKSSYVGDSQSEEMRLLILRDGSVAYKTLKRAATTSINAPLKEFAGDDFVVGLWLFTTTFDGNRAAERKRRKRTNGRA